jgi:hypothetical protein
VFEAFPAGAGIPSAMTRVIARLPEQAAKTPESQIAEVAVTPCPTDIDIEFEAAVTGMASQFATDVPPSSAVPMTEGVAATGETTPSPTEPARGEATAATAEAAVEAVVDQNDEPTAFTEVESQTPIEVAVIDSEEIAAPPPLQVPSEATPVRAVDEGMPGAIPHANLVFFDPFEMYPGLAFALNRDNDGPGTQAEPAIAGDRAADPTLAAVGVPVAETDAPVVPPTPEPEVFPQDVIGYETLAPPAAPAPASDTIEPAVAPAPEAIGPTAGTPEPAIEVTTPAETLSAPVVEPYQRGQRIASAVRLTGEALQAWAAVLSDPHELASCSAPVTR